MRTTPIFGAYATDGVVLCFFLTVTAYKSRFLKQLLDDEKTVIERFCKLFKNLNKYVYVSDRASMNWCT